jgi:hypothetical protein
VLITPRSPSTPLTARGYADHVGVTNINGCEDAHFAHIRHAGMRTGEADADGPKSLQTSTPFSAPFIGGVILIGLDAYFAQRGELMVSAR